MASKAVKRLMREYKEMKAKESEQLAFVAAPLDGNLFEWHFTLRGPEDSPFEKGKYHGRILLPSAYPFAPPDLIMLTPSGRFEVNKKICLSITSYHPKTWNPLWNISSVLIALRAFFLTPGQGAIGALDYTDAERRRYAHLSGGWSCRKCKQTNLEALPELTEEQKLVLKGSQSESAKALQEIQSWAEEERQKDGPVATSTPKKKTPTSQPPVHPSSPSPTPSPAPAPPSPAPSSKEQETKDTLSATTSQTSTGLRRRTTPGHSGAPSPPSSTSTSQTSPNRKPPITRARAFVIVTILLILARKYFFGNVRD